MSMMTKAKDIFLQAIDMESNSEREQYIEDACEQNEALHQKVLELIAAHDQPESYIKPTLGKSGTILKLRHFVTAKRSMPRGCQVGPYKLLQQIGEGGFGVVYMAEQTEPLRRKVAVKIIKPGMDTKEVVARFEAERQALALMDHPHVAKVLDGGATESGRPYFVMELVKGVAITEFCDENKLPIRDRLRLFATVCKAVHHAHQKGIIHRDIKPTNVLVTLHDGQPIPKVIDFGVSKAMSQQLTEKTLFTAFGQMIGTPQYMSPEQAEMSGLDVDTRSDIYSLGVLLYELLTGTTPLDPSVLRATAYAEMQRMIREDEPQRPSLRLSTLNDLTPKIASVRDSDSRKLGALVQGELDWIAMRALEKSRERRYESATALAADVERYLNNETVEACPPSVGYRFRKVLRRHKVAFTVGALVAVVLLLATVTSTAFALRAHRAKLVARDTLLKYEQEREKNREITRAAGEQALLNASNAYFDDHSPDQIESYLKQAEVLGVEPGRIEMLRGMIAFAKADTQTTIKHLTAAAKTNPDSMAVKMLLAQCYERSARDSEIVTLAKELSSMEPQTLEDYFYVGNVLAPAYPDRAIKWGPAGAGGLSGKRLVFPAWPRPHGAISKLRRTR